MSKRPTRSTSVLMVPQKEPTLGRTTTRSRPASGNDSRRITPQESMLSDMSIYSQRHDETRYSNMTIYFVLAQGFSEATCKPNLTSVFAFAKEREMNCIWMKEKDCLEHDPQYGNIFVMDPLEGPAYDKLAKSGNRGQIIIMGPQVLRYLVVENDALLGVDLAKITPLTVGMRNRLIATSSLSHPEKAEIQKKIEMMLGKVSNPLTKDVTHVVTKDILTDKVIKAYQINIPVMKIEWIDAVWEGSQSSNDFATDDKNVKFLCPIFYNLSICLSQIPLELKKAIQGVINSNGGSCTSNIQKNVTSVLVVPCTGGDKHKFATGWKVHCVKPAWVEACKSAGHVVSLQDFALEKIEGNRKKVAVRNNKDEDDLGVAVSTPMSSMVHSLNASTSQISGVVPGQFLTFNDNNQNKDRKQRNSTELTDKISLVLKNAESLGDFLDGCKVYISKFQILDEVRKLVNASGAIRLSEVNDNVTHVIVSHERKMPNSELELLLALGSRPYFLTIEWLLESALIKCPANEEDFKVDIEELKSGSRIEINGSSSTASRGSQISIVDMVENGHQSRNSKSKSKSNLRSSKGESLGGGRRPTLEEVVIVEEIPFAPQQEDVNPVEQYEERPADNADNSFHDEDMGGSQFTFRGTKFKVWMDNPSDQIEMETCIKQYKGVLSNDYQVFVLPPVYSTTDVKPKNGTKLRTKQWLNSCIENGMICEDMYCYIPLPAFPNIGKIFHNVVVAISQYTNSEKEFLSDLVTSMGGTYQDVFSKKTTPDEQVMRSTHLICSKTDTDKYLAAIKWGTPVVVAEWVLDCFKAKKKLDNLQFYQPGATKSDSESSQSCIPKTPRAVPIKNNKRGGNSATASSTNANTPQATSTPVAPVPVFKTPNSRPKKKNDDWMMEPVEKTESFLEYMAANPNPFADLSQNESFIKWKANRTPESEPDPSTLSPIIGAEYGFDRQMSRRLKGEIEQALRTPPPGPKGISLVKKLKKPTNNGMSTPIRVVMARDMDKLKNIYPKVDTPDVVKKYREEQERKQQIEQQMNAYTSSTPIPSRARSSLKRKSDSSLEMEQEEDSEEPHINKPNKSNVKKRLRIRTDSEEEEEEEEESEEQHSNSSESNEKSETSLEATKEKSRASVRQEHAVDEIEVVQHPIPKTLASMENLKNLLEANDMSRVGKAQKKSSTYSKYPSNPLNEDERPSPEEIDAPHVVWVNDDTDDDPEPPVPEPPVTRSSRTKVAKKSSDSVDDNSVFFKVPKRPEFIISGVGEAEKIGIIQQVEKLGGTVADVAYFTPTAFGLIADKLARSEKVLCCIAAGKPILSPSYLSVCLSKKTFLPITEEHLCKEEGNLTQACYTWLHRILNNSNDKPFSNQKFFFHGDAGAKAAAYTRLINAGGGEVVSSWKICTLVLSIDIKKALPPNCKVEVVPVTYLNEVILKRN